MKNKLLLLVFVLCTAVSFASVPKKIYINPGHGSWGPNDRPCATIPYPMLPGTGRPDTCGFYESNTNLWKTLELARRLQADGYTVRLSRYRNGPYPYVAGAQNAEDYNRPLSEICEEVESWGGDMFISIHSNAASDGALVNYPLFLYRGPDSENCVPGSKAMCQAVWPYLVECMKSGLEFQNYYNNSTNIRGDWDFYHSHSINSNGYDGYLGVLKHGTPGFLSEGYFHTYQPARHRALNPDYCYQEGLRYYRGIVSYFGTPADRKGYIMGVVKDRSQTMDGYNYYNYKEGMHDAYLPVNGATVRLRNADGEFMGLYTVDKKYNGIYAFYDLLPGTYYLDLQADGYTTQQGTTNKVIVKANSTVYPVLYMTKGTSTPFETVDGTVTVTVAGKGIVKIGDDEMHEGTGKSKVTPGEQAVFTFIPEEGSYLGKVVMDGVDVTKYVKSNTLTVEKVSSNIKLQVTFEKTMYTMTLTVGRGGCAVVQDTILNMALHKYPVAHGDDLLIKPRPFGGYDIKDLKIDKVSVLGDIRDSVYTLPDVTRTHRVDVTFQVAAEINNVGTAPLRVLYEDGLISVSGAKAGNMISVTDMSGKVIFRSRATDTDCAVRVSSTGVYIVRVGKMSFKLMVK